MFYVNPADSKKSNGIYDSKTKRKTIRTDFDIDNEKSVFQTTLQETFIEQANKDIEVLLDDIDKAGKLLYEETTIYNLRLYKESVKEFLQTASRTIFKVSVLRGRKVDMKIIRIIDEKLKFITDHFFELEKNKMNLLSEIEEIMGLVINVVL
jgi:hypothetical protein